MTPREVINAADRHRAAERAADWAQTKIRLGEKPVQRRGLLGFRKRSDAYREMEFTAEETRAIYEALSIVRRDHRDEAARYEAMVTTEEADQ